MNILAAEYVLLGVEGELAPSREATNITIKP